VVGAFDGLHNRLRLLFWNFEAFCTTILSGLAFTSLSRAYFFVC
jgi:hypothetical protein